MLDECSLALLSDHRAMVITCIAIPCWSVEPCAVYFARSKEIGSYDQALTIDGFTQFTLRLQEKEEAAAAGAAPAAGEENEKVEGRE